MKPDLGSLAHGAAARRLFVVAMVGTAVGAVCAVLAPWQLSAMVGWNVAGASLLVWVWGTVGHFDADQTRTHATSEDSSRVAAHLLLVSASVASLLGAAAALIKANDAHAAGKVVLTVAGVLTVVVSWTVVHTVFALRYAHEFYAAPIGGINFKAGDDPPDYQDFAYVAFTIGMTFQVSDTDIQQRTIRRTALRHALLAYLFGAVILAVTVNVIANLIR